MTLDNGEIDEQGRRAPGTRGDFSKGGLIAALDVTTGEIINTLTTTYVNKSGILSTAGNLLVTATYDGTIMAIDATTLEELWTFSTGIGIKAPVITYEVNGKQYFAVVAGERQPGDLARNLGVPGAETFPVRGTGAMLYVFTL